MTLPSLRFTPRLVAAATAGLLVLGSAGPAWASPESDAKDLFARGRELRANNDCASAAPLFHKAWSVYPQGLGSLRNFAECEEQLGHVASSKRAWLDLRRALVTTASDPKYEGWDKDAEAAASRLKAKVASFVVDVYVSSAEGESLANDKSGVELFVNGESLGTALVGAPLERDPGTYRVRAQAENAAPVEQIVNVAAGDNPRVTIRLTRKARPAAGGAIVAEPAIVSASGSGRKTLGYVVAGVGGAALIGSGVTFILRQSALGKVEDECPLYETQPCMESLRSTVDRGQLMSTLSPILLGVGVLGVAGGLALVLTAPKAAPEASAQRLSVQAGLGRVDATWRF